MKVLNALLIAVPLAMVSLPAFAQPPAPKASSKCATPEHRQLDFWIGDWDAYDVDAPGKVVARNRVDRILDGCVLRGLRADRRLGRPELQPLRRLAEGLAPELGDQPRPVADHRRPFRERPDDPRRHPTRRRPRAE